MAGLQQGLWNTAMTDIVVTRQADWDTLWQDVGDGRAPPVDFSREMVLVAAGPLERIRGSAGRLDVQFARKASTPIGLAVQSVIGIAEVQSAFDYLSGASNYYYFRY